MKISTRIKTLILIASISALSHAEENDRCDIAGCKAGEKVITFATDEEFYFMCPTRELSEYTTIVIGFIAMHHYELCDNNQRRGKRFCT